MLIDLNTMYYMENSFRAVHLQWTRSSLLSYMLEAQASQERSNFRLWKTDYHLSIRIRTLPKEYQGLAWMLVFKAVECCTRPEKTDQKETLSAKDQNHDWKRARISLLVSLKKCSRVLTSCNGEFLPRLNT